MGQAKLRSKEIAELKAKGPAIKLRNREVEGFGAYYHDDQPDGIGIFLSQDCEPAAGWTNITFNTLRELVAKELHDTPLELKQQRIDYAWSDLKENIVRYNNIVFGTDERQMTATPHLTELSDELSEVFVSTITNIWLLERMGQIHNDDYNGAIVYYK